MPKRSRRSFHGENSCRDGIRLGLDMSNAVLTQILKVGADTVGHANLGDPIADGRLQGKTGDEFRNSKNQ